MRLAVRVLLLLAVGVSAAPASGSDSRELYRRGSQAFASADIAGALEAWDELVRKDPAVLPELWQRGIALYYAKRWDDCIAQFEVHRTVNPKDAENSVWHYLCVAARDGEERARKGLFPADDPRIPMMTVHRLYAGETDPDAVLEAVADHWPNETERRVREFYAHLYVALWHESRGATERTRHHLVRALNGPPIGHTMETVARVHLKLLDGE